VLRGGTEFKEKDMGWLYGWNTRAELADHLINGNGVKTIKHCFKGNNLWAVQEGTKRDGTPVLFIALYMLRGRNGSSDGWGYKDMDESAGPTATNCPLSYLDMVPVGPGYAAEWREQVRAAAARSARKLTVGEGIKYGGNGYKVVEVLPKGKGYMVQDLATGCGYRLPARYIKNVTTIQDILERSTA
jgi:hypothetical protein